MPVRASLRLIPNIISLSRVILAAAFVMRADTRTRILIVLAAAITDMLDGWLARRAGLVTRFGALVDPFADRVFVLVAVASLVYEGTLSTMQYFVMISRDLMTAVGFLVARSVSWLRPVEFRARRSGKIVTALQLASFVAILSWPNTTDPLVWLVGAASLYSIVDYTYALWESADRGATRS
ncbi:MAG TPA: CDP-alcohol phosphatidyltransferase family protein [Gemmatimonadaceae bacterium]